MDQNAPAPPTQPLKWYQGLDRYCWVVLVIAALGWLFDTMDQNLFNLVRVPSLRELMKPVVEARRPEIEKRLNADGRAPASKEDVDKAVAAELGKEVKTKGTWVTSIFIIGWASGGLIFGILGDRLGRTKTMILTIVTYAVFTGLSGLANNWLVYALLRFMTGLGVGGEWAAGAALVAEVFPARSRSMALGLLQALSAVGNMLAAVITLVVAQVVPEDQQASSWRIVYFVGFFPSLLVLWIRRSVKEPEAWKEAKDQGKKLGSISELFVHPTLRRNTFAAVLLALAGMMGLWGIGFFSADMLRDELVKAGRTEKDMATLSSWMFFLQNAGSFFGIYCFAAFAERYGKRPAFFFSFGLAWASVLAYFWGLQGAADGAFTRALILAPIMGFCTLGPFAGYTVYFPYLYPTRLRATGCGLCYNVARYLVPAAPLMLGHLAVSMGGFAPAATVVSAVYVLGFVGTMMGPETKGKPLPEDKDFEGELLTK